MKKIIMAYLLINFTATIAQEERIEYDSNTGNYTLYYYGQDCGDSLVSYVYVPANKVDPYIKCNVERINVNDSLLYSYSIKNGENGKLNLHSFTIITNTCDDIIQIKNGWHSGNSYANTDELICNGFGWIGDNGLAPGWDFVSGFGLKCKLLPKIGEVIFMGNNPTMYLPCGEPSMEIGGKFDSLTLEVDKSCRRKTVIPDFNAFNYSTGQLMDSVTNYLSISFELGWVKDEQTRDKYISYINNVKEKEEIGDSEEARNILDKIMSDAVADSTENMTSEAFALIYYNAEYLKSQIGSVLSVPR